MSEILCGYMGERDAALMSYVYDEMTPADRAAFDAHLAICATCRSEVRAFGDVRQQLAQWTPPDFGASTHATSPNPQPAIANRTWWREIPAWAQVAAALLFLGVSAGIANLDVRYGKDGLNIRTGWMSSPRDAGTAAARSTSANPAIASSVANTASLDGAPWRADLAALERQLRTEFHDIPASVSASTHSSGANDAELMRRLKALIDESERRQQRELALRVAELARDVNAQRQADLRKIDQSLGVIQDRTGVEVLKNRQALDYLLQRVSQRQ